MSCNNKGPSTASGEAPLELSSKAVGHSSQQRQPFPRSNGHCQEHHHPYQIQRQNGYNHHLGRGGRGNYNNNNRREQHPPRPPPPQSPHQNNPIKHYYSNNRGRGGGGGYLRGQHFGRRGNSTTGYNNTLRDNYYGHQQQNRKPTFYCCPCEREFKSQIQLDEHNTEHIVCGLDGCKFEAHFLVVTKHIRMQHEGNLFDRMKHLSTPEDINKWRAERKKNFPTAENIQQKLKDKAEGKKEGNVTGAGGGGGPIGAPVFRYKMDDQQSNRAASYSDYQHNMKRLQMEQNYDWRTRPFAPDKKRRDERVPFFSLNKSKVVCLENFYLKVKVDSSGKIKKKETKVKWKGFKVKNLERAAESDGEGESNEIPISDDDDCSNDEVAGGASMTSLKVDAAIAPVTSAKASTNMGLLLVNYSSASDSENDEESCEAVPKTNPLSSKPALDNRVLLQSSVVGTSTETKESEFLKGSKAGTSGSSDPITQSFPAMIPHDNSDADASDSMIIEEFQEDAQLKSKPVFSKVGGARDLNRKKWRRTKYLETLLQDQIRKERNVIIQACRYIKDKNFFDK